MLGAVSFNNDNIEHLEINFACMNCGETGSCNMGHPVDVNFDRYPEEEEQDA
jgi:hypothetical protein